MKPRFTLFRRGQRFSCQDAVNGRQTSLRTTDEEEARTLVHARNEAHRQPALNLHIARAYLSATDPEIARRTWQTVMDEMGKTKRGPTLHRHHSATIIAQEQNVEHRAFYECCWHLGGAQTDIANLEAEDVDWGTRVVAFHRRKTGSVSIIRFGPELERVLQSLPNFGPFFPNHRLLTEEHRAKEFWRACRRAGVSGVSLHCYRYAWAERAKVCGYPERFAGHARRGQLAGLIRRLARILLFPMQAYRIGDLGEPSAIPGLLHEFRRREKFCGIRRRASQWPQEPRRHQHRDVVDLAVQNPRRLFHRQARWWLPQQSKKSVLVVFHVSQISTGRRRPHNCVGLPLFR